MRLGIGIDTGGTYTDAVIYDFDEKMILNSAKALTTKEDLSIGIGNALDSLDLDLLKKAEIVSLSTTLATNACVENKHGRAKLIFIGVDKKVAANVGEKYGLPGVNEIFFIEKASTDNGEPLVIPDWNSLIEESKSFLKDAESIGIVEINSMNNNATSEKKAKALLSEEHSIPIICGHELFSDLNVIKRGSSTLLNARLVPIIENFLKAIKGALKARGITAPVVIVRSDGSLMSESFTAIRPVETLLCGPAASAMGGIELTNESNSIIIDMGGTTTDIAVVKDGVPVKANDGINLGKWRTFVKGLYIDTFGLGGDNAVRFDANENLVIEPVRIIPLSIAADKWPVITEKLNELIIQKQKHTYPLHEFFCLIKDISENSNYSKQEIVFCRALKNGPLIYTDAAEAIGTDVYNLNMDRLEREGVVMRCGLTPTDIMHIKGDFRRYNIEAAKLGAKFVSACVDESEEDLCDLVYDTVKKTLYSNIIRMLLEDKYSFFKGQALGEGIDMLISDSWEKSKNQNTHGFFNIDLTTAATLIGIGAPIHIFLPDVAKALGTKYIVPNYAGVANALGALIGNVSATCEIEVRPENNAAGTSKYIVYGKSHNSMVEDMEEAIKIALSEAKSEARNEAIKRGALGDISVFTEVFEDKAIARGKEILFGFKVIAKAIGRVTI